LAIERVLLVRHGLTDWNTTGRWQGYEPVALNEEGWAQARMLAESLRGRPIRGIVSSDLPRAFQTASAIGEVVGVQPVTDERWREFHLGIFQGFTRDEMIAKYPAEWEAFNADYWDYHIPNGESRRMMQERVYNAWENAVTVGEGPELVVVSHGGSLKILLLKLFPNMPDLDAVHLGNTSVTTVERIETGWRLDLIASIDHLSAQSITSVSGEASAL
jgi:broad specificity phosphatase PhoE